MSLAKAFATFSATHPTYAQTEAIDQLRDRDYGRLARERQIYLDYTGGGLHADSQIHAHVKLLTERVLGNPHSNNPTSLAMTELVERARQYVLEYFNAPPEEYLAVFTPNASGALRVVGEAYCFSEGGQYALTFDNHNSVNGIREFARAKGAKVSYIPVVAPDLRLDMEAAVEQLDSADSSKNNLFAFPAQSNFSGVQHSLELIELARERGWDVLLDCAAFAPTNRCNIGRLKPDFAAFSFYKMFGYPTGIGCLLIRRDKLHKLHRPWFAGGTIQIASVQGDGHYLHTDEAAFEDGTVDYLNIPAIETGLRHLNEVGMHLIHERVVCLTGWLIDTLTKLCHSNGKPLVRILGPANTKARGGTVTVVMFDKNGRAIDDRRVEELANHANISLRTGCFCNPGAGEVAHQLTSREMVTFFDTGKPMTFLELRAEMLKLYDKSVSAIRVSVGLVTNFDDVYYLVEFMRGFLDKTSEEIGSAEFSPSHTLRDAA